METKKYDSNYTFILKNVKTGFCSTAEAIAPKKDPEGKKKYVVYIVLDKSSNEYTTFCKMINAFKQQNKIPPCKTGMVDYDDKDAKGVIPSNEKPELKNKVGIKLSSSNKIPAIHDGAKYEGEVGFDANVDIAFTMYYTAKFEILMFIAKAMNIHKIGKSSAVEADPFALFGVEKKEVQEVNEIANNFDNNDDLPF